MKKVNKDNKEFIVIPEGKRVKGSSYIGWFAKDNGDGERFINKAVIASIIYRISDFDGLFDFSATSYCDERDEFNEKTGIEVCSAKMDYKAHMKAAKTYDRVYRVLAECMAIVQKRIEKHLKKAKAIDDDMVRMYGRSKSE